MGTRADFYIGKGKDAKWIGSIAYDGYPDGEVVESGILIAINESAFIAGVQKLSNREDFTNPEQGWPWPWEDSCTTDWAYCFVTDHVEAFTFGRSADLSRDDYDYSSTPKAEFPDMTSQRNVTYGSRSGVLFLTTK